MSRYFPVPPPTDAARTALHEAAHFVVGRKLDFLDVHCRMDRVGNGPTYVRGPRASDGVDDRGIFEYLRGVDRACLALAVAGELAEELAFDHADPAANDRDAAERLLAAFPEGEREHVRGEARGMARDVLRSEWRIVEAVAAALSEDGHFP